MPLPFEDWDNEGGSILEHKQRRKEVVGEVLSVIAVNKLLSLFMFVPLIYTGKYPDQEISNSYLIFLIFSQQNQPEA